MGRADIHLSKFGHLGRIGVICPLRIPRLGIDHVSERSCTEQLLPRLKNVLEATFREIRHLGSNGL